MIITRATIKDIDQILNLLSQVLEIHANIRGDIFNHGVTKYQKEELIEMMKDDNNPIYVIKKDDKVLGYAFCQIIINKHPHLTKIHKTFYIDDFCIDEKYRRQHIGETLFGFIKEEATRLDMDEITLNEWVGNEGAKTFYEKMGLKARKI